MLQQKKKFCLTFSDIAVSCRHISAEVFSDIARHAADGAAAEILSDVADTADRSTERNVVPLQMHCGQSCSRSWSWSWRTFASHTAPSCAQPAWSWNVLWRSLNKRSASYSPTTTTFPSLICLTVSSLEFCVQLLKSSLKLFSFF